MNYHVHAGCILDCHLMIFHKESYHQHLPLLTGSVCYCHMPWRKKPGRLECSSCEAAAAAAAIVSGNGPWHGFYSYWLKFDSKCECVMT